MKRSGADMILGPMLVTIGMVAVYVFLLYGGSVIPGAGWATVRDGLIHYWPWLSLAFVGISVLNEVI